MRASRNRNTHREPLPAPTPADVLRNMLTSAGVTQDELAAALGVSRFSVNQLVNGRRNVTADMALRLSRAMSTSAEFWLNLQQSSDLAVARNRLAAELKQVQVVRPPSADSELFYDVDG